MRRTVKYRKGIIVARDKKIVPKTHEPGNKTLYELLEKSGYWWDAKHVVWKESTPPSTSIFADQDGSATDVGRIRVMAHPDRVHELANKLRKTPGLTVIEVSEKAYPNRKGIGSRLYITVVMS